MIGVAFLLIGLSVGDLVAGGLTGEIETIRRLASGLGASLGTVLLLALLMRPALDSFALALAIALAISGSLAWMLSKLGMSQAEAREDGSAPRRWALGGLAVLGVSLVLALASAASLHTELPRVTSWLHGLPFAVLADLGGAEALMLVAILLFLTAPANSIVRVLLTAASTRWKQSEEQLKGGRYIGVIERWMIFGLALAGEPTAAALVISAKGLLRFPELSRKNESVDIDEITEYFLLGSLTSWALALALVLLVV